MLINVLDEPRVLSKGISTGLDVQELNGQTTPSRESRPSSLQPAVPTLTLEMGRMHASNRNIETAALGLSSRKQDTLDLCQHTKYEGLHRLWSSPKNLHTTHIAVPILLTGVISIMGDKPIPAPAYTRSDYTYDEIEDLL
jgi:hypothetical protein